MKINHIVVDIEANGPVPGLFSMVSIGAVHHENPQNTFYAELKPISDKYIPEAYRVNKFTHEQALTFEEPEPVMIRFDEWLENIAGADRVIFVSDTTVFDGAFVYWYLWKYVGRNKFGHSSMSIQQLYKGLRADMRASIHSLRDTTHTHNALDDAIGNHEALTKVLDLLYNTRVVVKNEELPERSFFGRPSKK